MTQSSNPPDDKDLFRAAMQGVKPLKSDNKIESQSNPQRKLRKKIIQRRVEDNIFSDHIAEKVGGGEVLNYAQSGIQNRVMQDLRRGKIPYTGMLDLHGMTVIEARRMVTLFLRRCLKRQCKCVLIVHGKGGIDSNIPPPLKNNLNSWLRQTPDVLAFCSALPRDGGTGAVYILLKKHRDDYQE